MGAIAYVDDLCLISTNPQELQHMINEVQRWCELSRIEISTDKTKTLTFFPRTRQPTPPFHITKQFPTPTATHLEHVSSFRYLGVTLDPFLTMTPLKDFIVLRIKQSSGKLQRQLRDLRSARPLYSHHHSTLGKAQSSPTTNLAMWKSCVLVQGTQYIRYAYPPDHPPGRNSDRTQQIHTIDHGVLWHPLLPFLRLGYPPYHYMA